MSTTNIGSMCVVLHRERSFHNVDIRVLKSALQKYGRRAMISRGIWCLIELDLFSLLECQPDLYLSVNEKQLTTKQISMNSQRIRSNLINRLVAMMSEDVGPVRFDLPAKVYRWFIDWNEQRRNISSRKILLEFYFSIVNEQTERIRLISDLRTVFNLPKCLTENQNLHKKLLQKFQMNELFEILYGKTNQRKKNEEIYQELIEHLEKKSDLAFAYLSILFRRNCQSMIKNDLWTFLLDHSSCRSSCEALAFFYKKLKHKEHFLYLYHAMCFIIYEEEIGRISPIEETKKFDFDVEQIYNEHFDEKTKFEFDSFVFDLHTGDGTSRLQFAREGATVTNECRILFNEKYRKMYEDFKILIDEDEERKKQRSRSLSPTKKKLKVKENFSSITTNDVDEPMPMDFHDEIQRFGYKIEVKDATFVTNELMNLPRGQKRTSSHKKSVFVSTDFIYKGPYRIGNVGDEKRLKLNLTMTRSFLLLEEHLKIPVEYRSILDWNSIVRIDQTDEFYLKQKSIGEHSNDVEIVTTKIEENVKILRRGSHVHRLIELEKKPSTFIDDHPNIARATLQHFYLRYLLNIGDSGTWNILVRRDENERKISGIDLEEIRSKKSTKNVDILALLFSKISKEQRTIYRKYLDDILIFKETIDRQSSVGNQLENLFQIDLNLLNERIEEMKKLMCN